MCVRSYGGGGHETMELGASVSMSILEKLVQSCSFPDSWRGPPDAEVQALIGYLEELRSSVLDLSKEDEDEDDSATSSSTLKMSLTSQLQELCYDAEDYLEMAQHSRGGCSWQISWVRSKATRQRPALISAKDLSGLISRVNPAKEIAQAYIKSASSRTTTKENGPRPQEEPAKSSSRRAVYSDDTLQPDSHDEQLVRLLALESDQQLKTVAIHGLPGVGKTTLARRLYHCYEGRFHCGAFLRASRNLQDTTRLLATMLSKIKGQQGCRYWGGSGDEQDLIDSIRQHLQGKS
jgi:hypothetical protein